MKKICLGIIMLVVATVKVNGQCVPDTNITHNVPGIYPDTVVNLPHAGVGIPYSTDIQVNIFASTVVSGLPVLITDATVLNVTGLPTGFTYACTPSNCIFPGGSNACILLQGPAPTAPQIGEYPLQVMLRIHGTVFGLPQSSDTTITGYKLIIENIIGIPAIAPASFEVSQNHPNPFKGFTEFTISSPSNELITFKMTDLLGNTILSKVYTIQKGTNRIPISSADLEPGIYLYTVSNGRNTVVRRMIVSSNP